ncbi:CopG family transcriptional regulator [Streptomyces bacillaris]|uniref:ribbon-helix-helix domain-containing protein n=1 Tax=Streptomyces bacillaris TaxID=68179 RepID=UPI00364629A5
MTEKLRCWYMFCTIDGMALKRTNVYADDEDLALIKEAAGRLGVSEAELIREGIHRIALARRVWDEPFVTDEETFDLGGPVTRDDVREAVNDAFGGGEPRDRGRVA